MRLSSLIGPILGLALAACGGPAGIPPPPGETLRSDAQRISAPDVDPDELAAQISANSDFAAALYGRLAAEGDGNLFFSPHSIELALAMTWAGARGQTEADMAATLRFGLAQERLHPIFNHIDLELARRGEGAQGADGQGFRLRVLNTTFGQLGYPFEAPFLDVLALHYGAGLQLMDFSADPEGARLEINDWVELATEGRIEDLIPPRVITDLTRLVLVNAIYFNAAWEAEFDRDQTRAGPFELADGQLIEVPCMHLSAELPLFDAEGYLAVELPYDGGELSMLVLLPDRGGLAALEARLGGVLLAEARAGLAPEQVALSMPRWRSDGGTFSLKRLLSELGMAIAFDPGRADLTGMSARGGLYIQDALHQAFIEVTESGTEAAAATAVIVGERGSGPSGRPVELDRPFVYAILDRPTGQLLFLGRMGYPRG